MARPPFPKQPHHHHNHNNHTRFAICHDGMQGAQMVLGGGNDNLRDGELKVAPLLVRFQQNQAKPNAVLGRVTSERNK